MNEGFQDMLRENAALKDQVIGHNTIMQGLCAKVEGLKATVSQLNSKVSQFSTALQNLTSLMISHSNQLRQIVK